MHKTKADTLYSEKSGIEMGFLRILHEYNTTNFICNTKLFSNTEIWNFNTANFIYNTRNFFSTQKCEIL